VHIGDRTQDLSTGSQPPYIPHSLLLIGGKKRQHLRRKAEVNARTLSRLSVLLKGCEEARGDRAGRGGNNAKCFSYLERSGTPGRPGQGASRCRAGVYPLLSLGGESLPSALFVEGRRQSSSPAGDWTSQRDPACRAPTVNGISQR